MIKIPTHLFFIMSLLLVVGSCDSSGGPPPAMVQKSDEPIDGLEQDPNVVQVVGDLGDPLFGFGLDDDPVSEDVVKVGDLGAPSFGISLDNAPHKADDESGGIGNDDYTDRDLDRAYFRYENLADWLGECPHCGAPDAYSGEDYGCDVCHAYLDAGDCKDCAIYLADYMAGVPTLNYIVVSGSNSFGNWITPNYIIRAYQTDAWISPNNMLGDRNYSIDSRNDGSLLNGRILLNQDYGTLKSSTIDRFEYKSKLLEDATTPAMLGNKGLTGVGNPPTSAGSSQVLSRDELRKNLLQDEIAKTPPAGNSPAINGKAMEETTDLKNSSLNKSGLHEQRELKNFSNETNPRPLMGNRTFSPQRNEMNRTFMGGRHPTGGASSKNVRPF